MAARRRLQGTQSFLPDRLALLGISVQCAGAVMGSALCGTAVDTRLYLHVGL
jgi:hypothetical protein